MVRSIALLAVALAIPALLAWNALIYATAQRAAASYDRDPGCTLGADRTAASACAQEVFSVQGQPEATVLQIGDARGDNFTTTLAGGAADQVAAWADTPHGVTALLFRKQPVLIAADNFVTETRANPDWRRHHAYPLLWIFGSLTVLEGLFLLAFDIPGSLVVTIGPVAHVRR